MSSRWFILELIFWKLCPCLFFGHLIFLLTDRILSHFPIENFRILSNLRKSSVFHGFPCPYPQKKYQACVPTILMPPTFPIVSLNRSTPNFSGEPHHVIVHRFIRLKRRPAQLLLSTFLSLSQKSILDRILAVISSFHSQRFLLEYHSHALLYSTWVSGFDAKPSSRFWMLLFRLVQKLSLSWPGIFNWSYLQSERSGVAVLYRVSQKTHFQNHPSPQHNVCQVGNVLVRPLKSQSTLFLPDRTRSPIIMRLKFGHQTSKMMSSFQMNSFSKFYSSMKFFSLQMWLFFSSLRYLYINIMYKGLIASQIFTHNLTV